MPAVPLADREAARGLREIAGPRISLSQASGRERTEGTGDFENAERSHNPASHDHSFGNADAGLPYAEGIIGRECAMTDDLVLYETDENIAIVTMNRPEKLNAISHDLRSGVSDALLRADEDKAVNVVILRSEGRSFCVGYDIDNDTPERAARRFDALKWHESLSEDMRFETIPWYMRKPVIASVQGHALGGGCELAMFCDITIAADNALFGEPEIHFSNVGPAIVMPWIIGFKKARELLYLGDMIDAETALDLGMVNRVVPLDELRERTLRFARRMALIAPEALQGAKLSINRGADAAGFRAAMQAGLDVLAPLYAARTEVGVKFTEIRQRDGLRAALKWRRDQFAELDDR
jgi:enoyl-CoA hydratase/carnithine racemase